MSYAFRNGGHEFLAIGLAEGDSPPLPAYEMIPVPGGRRLRLTRMPFPGCLNHMPYAEVLLSGQRRDWAPVRRKFDILSPLPTLPPFQHLVLYPLCEDADWKTISRDEAVRRLRARHRGELGRIEEHIQFATYPMPTPDGWQKVPRWAQYP